MEDEQILKIVFWAATLAMFVVIVGCLLLLAHIYHNMQAKERKKVLSHLPADANPVFTKREIQVLHLVTEGYNATEISDKLCISSKTVEIHKSNMMEKAKTRKMIGVINYAYSKGILPLKNPKN